MNTEKLIKELSFKAVRSSGPGGQHVNKTATKIELIFNLEISNAISKIEKELLRTRLGSRITAEGNIILYCGTTRSQHRNKVIAIERLLELIQQGLKKRRSRKKTNPTRSSVEKRLLTKKKIALKKNNRKPPDLN